MRATNLETLVISYNKYCTLLLLSYSGKLRERCHKLDESHQSGDIGLPIIAEQITSINLDLAARALLFGFESFKSGRESRACIVCRPGTNQRPVFRSCDHCLPIRIPSMHCVPAGDINPDPRGLNSDVTLSAKHNNAQPLIG